jgi:pimeloyl-ACP methyl ester carboxylesterase
MNEDTDSSTVTVAVDDAVVRCLLTGVDREGVDPVVLLPGLGGSTETEFSFLRPLLARTARVLAVDLQYAAPSPATLESAVGQLAAVMRQVLPGRNVTLVGFSVGATVAAAFAEASPEVGALVLVAPVLQATERHRMVAVLRSRLLTGDLDAVRDLDSFTAHSASFLQAHLPAPLAPQAESAGITAKHELFASTDLADSVPRISAPTLVVGATQDDLAGVDQARMVFASLPNARYTEIDSGHAVLAERPAEVLALIREFAAHPLRHPAGSVLEGARP